MGSRRNVLVAVFGLAAAFAVVAQESGSLRWRNSPLGLQAGQRDLLVPCGSFTVSCNEATTLPLYSSATAPRAIAMQVAPTDSFGLRAPQSQGFNVSVIGKAGLGWDLGVYGRVGTTFNRASSLSGSEGGLTYGVGLSWDFSRSASAAVGMDSYDVRSAVREVRDVRTSLGLQWRY